MTSTPEAAAPDPGFERRVSDSVARLAMSLMPPGSGVVTVLATLHGVAEVSPGGPHDVIRAS